MPITQFSDNLLRMKAERNLTNAMFAASCDVSESALSGYLYDHKIPPICTLLKMCNSLHTFPNSLLNGLYKTPTEIEQIFQINRIMVSLGDDKRRLYEGIFEQFVELSSQGIIDLAHANLGERIALLRKDAHFSTVSFAKCCSLSRSALAGIESSQKEPGTLAFLEICSALHVSPEYLLCKRIKSSSYSNIKFANLTPRQLVALHRIGILIEH